MGMTAPAKHGEYEQLETVRFSADGVSEMDQHRTVIFVPRAEIRRIELEFGAGAERPLVLAGLGLVFLGVFVATTVTIILAVLRGGVTLPVEMITGIAFAIPAWWLLDLSFRRRWFIRVHTQSGARKLLFHKTRDPHQLQSFVDTARRRFGYA